MRTTHKIAASLLAMLVIAGSITAWHLWRGQQRAALVQAAVPALPDASGWSAEFMQKLQDATASALQASRPQAWLAELVRLYLANGFSDEAEPLLRALIQLEPGQARWTYYLADLRQTAGDFEEASLLLNKTIQLAPDYAPAHLKLAELLFKRGRLDEASVHYRRRLALLPDDPYAQLGLARVAMQLGDDESARSTLETIVESHPTFPSALNLLAEMAAQTGNEQAAEELRRRGHRAGRFREAPDDWQEELHAWCFDPYRLQVLASILEQTGRLEESVPYLEKALRLAPDDGDAYEDLGTTLVLLGRFDDARTVLEKGLEVDPDEQSLYFTLPLALRKLGRPALAVAVLERGLQRFPEVADMHNHLGIAHDDARNPAAAMAAYRAALAVDVDHAEASLNLGKSLIAQGDEAAGMRLVERALEIDPWFVDALIYISGREIDADDLDQADLHLSRLERLEREKPEVRQLRAFWYLRRGRAAAVAGRTEDAVRDFVAGAKVDPTVGELHGNLGALLAQDERFTEAAAAFARFVAASPKEPVAYLYLGGALARSGRNAEALRALRAGLQVAQENGDQEAARRFAGLIAQLEAK